MNPADLALPSRFEEFRPGQLDAAVDVASSDARFPMANAPTGAGKSLLGMTAGSLVGGRTLYVVSTKGLQDQVGAEFSECGVSDIRGASNYRCKHHRTGCDVGGEVGCPLRKADGPCPYMAAVRSARQAKTVVTNYAYRLATANQPGESIGEFDLMVLDEAHLAHDSLANAASIELNRDTLARELRAKLPDSLDVDELVAWAVGIAEGASIAARQSTQNRALQRACRAVIRLAALAGRSGEWAADPLVGEDGSSVVAPVWAGEFAESMLYRGTPKVLLMSATLLPEMRQYLGIDGAQSAWYELPSSFPAKRRPFQFVRGTMPIRVDYRMDEGRWGMLVSRVDRYMGARVELERKGLVHTRSYARQQEFVRDSRHRDIMVAPRSWELRRTVERFKDNEPPPYVLASPAIEEGYDFKGDEARWQVLLKVPFVDTRSNLMKARAKDKGYSNLLTAQTIIQCAGRIMRASNDYGECVAPDTKVLTDDLRWVPAGDIEVGQRLLTIEENARITGVKAPGTKSRRCWTWASVEKSRISTMPRVKVIADDRGVICTPNHPWLVFGKGNHQARMLVWRRADCLVPDDQLVIALPMWQSSTSYLDGWLSGFADGEGCLSIGLGQRNRKVNKITLAQVVGPTLDLMRYRLTEAGFTYRSVVKVHNDPKWKDAVAVIVGGGLPEVLRFLGQTRPERLIGKFLTSDRGEQFRKFGLSRVVKVESLPDGDICSLQTSSKTYLADGLVAHNTALFDDHWDWFRKAVNWPGWFRESWVESEQAPEPLVV